MPERQYTRFDGGVVTDEARHLIAPNALRASQDFLPLDDGTLSKRGGLVTALSAGSAIRPEHAAILDSSELDNLTSGILYDELTGGVGAPVQVAAFAPSSANFPLSSMLSLAIGAVLNGGPGWATPSVAANGTLAGGGRPARYFNRILRPNGIPASIAAAHEYRPYSIWGGAQFGKTAARTGTAVITLTQNDPVLTGFAGADTAAVEVGMIGRFSDGTHHYSGRVIAVGATTITFSPAPSLGTWNTGGVQWVITPISSPARRVGASPIIGARALTVWGDRVILGGVAYDMLNAGTKLQVNANRLVWGILPAIDSGLVGTVTTDGIRESNSDTFLTSDFDDVMGLETIVGLEPVNQGELLVLGYPRCHRIVGYFTTLTTQTGGGNTWDVRPVQDSVACISDAATTSTPIGIFFAGHDGIYLYRNGKATNVLEGRRRNEYVLHLKLGTQIIGGGYLGNNLYYFCFQGNLAWVCNFDHGSFRWFDVAMPSGVGQCVFEPARIPAGYLPAKNTSGASSTLKLTRIEGLYNPGASNASDAGGATPVPTFTTKTFTEPTAGMLKALKAVELVFRLKDNTVSAAVAVIAGLNGEDGVTTIGTITGDAAGSAQLVRFAVAPRIVSKGFAIRIASFSPTVTAQEFQLDSVMLDSEPLNRR